MKNLLFATVDIPSLDKDKATADILSVGSEHWFWDEYRATRMLPLMTKGGQPGKEGTINRMKSDPFMWLPYVPTDVVDWFETVVFPWMGMRSRVMALMTKPRFENNEHIDCDPHNMGSLQHKFRIVIHGRTDTLYFITSNGNVKAPNVEGPFVMDGSWPHGMHNDTDDFKLTLAVGAPWNGKQHYDDAVVLLSQDGYSMPNDYKKYFKRPGS